MPIEEQLLLAPDSMRKAVDSIVDIYRAKRVIAAATNVNHYMGAAFEQLSNLLSTADSLERAEKGDQARVLRREVQRAMQELGDLLKRAP